MFSLFRILFLACLSGLVTSLLVVGAVGLWYGVPLAFLEVLPGDDLTELRQFPRFLLISGMAGFVIGCLGGLASHLASERIHVMISTLLIGLAAVLTIRATHPGINLTLDSGWLDYLESYRLTILATLGATAVVVVLGWLLHPLSALTKSSDNDR